jgi:SAM-dependent methyltransferase
MKNRAQRVFSALPGGHHLNYIFQRTLGGLPLPVTKLGVEVDKASAHLAALGLLGIDPVAARTFEFGAGYDLHLPLIQAALGLRRQTVVDIRRVARSSLVMAMARRLSDLAEVPVGWSPAIVQVGGSMADVLAANGITYLAPADARATTLDTGTIDAVTTVSTLEHIPPDDLAAILRECHRLIRHGGGMSMLIDYSDHWSHFDHSITEYNFLQFTESRWRHLSPAS